MRNILSIKTSTLLYFSWIVVLLGVAGSLIYSEVIRVPICDLCWYQRMAMYPLVLIYPIGIILKDKRSVIYSFPLLIAGLLLSTYQVLLQAAVIPDTSFGCGVSSAVSCSEITYRLFDLITIPQQALAGFGVLLGLNVWALFGKGDF